MRRYLKIGVFTIAVLAIGYLIGTGSIGNFLRFGDETIAAAADEAETEAKLQELNREFATQERPPSECFDMTIGSGTEIENQCEDEE
jgi:hypothetical protein